MSFVWKIIQYAYVMQVSCLLAALDMKHCLLVRVFSVLSVLWQIAPFLLDTDHINESNQSKIRPWITNATSKHLTPVFFSYILYSLLIQIQHIEWFRPNHRCTRSFLTHCRKVTNAQKVLLTFNNTTQYKKILKIVRLEYIDAWDFFVRS